MSQLRVEDVVAHHGDLRVLDGVRLDVPSGQTLAVLGQSGSGKSTLLRVIAGLHAPTAGRVLLADVDVTDVPTHRRGVGMVFQHLALFPRATVAENIGFGLRLAGRPRKERDAEVAAWLDRVDLAGLQDRDVAALSGGQRQRVALVRALASRPAVLLLDEPLGAIDAGLRGDLLSLLRSLFVQEATTAVLVTHDPAEAAAIADRVAVLDAGRVVQVDDPHRLWSAPANGTVARLMDHPNVLASPGGGVDVIPPEAIRLERGPDADATVLHLTAGATWHATLTHDDGRQLVVRVEPGDAPAVGDRRRVVVEAGAVVHLAE